MSTRSTSSACACAALTIVFALLLSREVSAIHGGQRALLQQEDCAAAVAQQVLNSSSGACSAAGNGSLQGLVEAVLRTSAACTPALVKTTSWMQLPGWINAVLSEMFGKLVPKTLLMDVVQMPSVESISRNSSATMRDYITITDGIYPATTADLSGFSPSYIQFNFYFNAWAENACSDLSALSGPLHPRVFLLLFYRPDSMAAMASVGKLASAQPPASWDDMLGVLAAHKQLVESGAAAKLDLPQHGVCITPDPNCGRVGDVLAAIAASVTQTSGTSSGYTFDLSVPPPAAAPLVNSTGWRYSIDLLRQILSYNAPSDANLTSKDVFLKCPMLHPYFKAGNCLMTLEWDMTWYAMATYAAPAMRRPGSWAVAPLPGSRMVMDRSVSSSTGSSSSSSAGSSSSSSVVPCTPELCATSVNHDLLYLTSSGRSGAEVDATVAAAAAAAAEAGASLECGLAGVARVEAAAAAPLRQSTPPYTLISRAPYSALFQPFISIDYDKLVRMDAVNEVSMTHYSIAGTLDQVRRLRQNVTDRARATLGYVADNGTWHGLSYVRAPWWTVTAGQQPFEVEHYAGYGLDADTAGSYLRAVWHAMHSPNMAADIQAPAMVNWFRWVMGYAGESLLPPEPPTTAGTAAAAAATPALAAVPMPTDNVTDMLLSVFNQVNEAYSSGSVRAAYENSISAAPWRPPRKEAEKGGYSLSQGEVAGVVVGAIVGTLAVAVVAAVLLWHLRRSHRDILGHVRAPKLGPDTTLLVTDVQNSTLLWEMLPAGCMDVSIKLHHVTLRTLLHQHDGYESAVEGDSFIIAFASSTKAARFAAAAQLALMDCPWPPALLAHPEGCVVMVEPINGGMQLTAAHPAAAVGGGANGGSRPARAISARGLFKPEVPILRIALQAARGQQQPAAALPPPPLDASAAGGGISSRTASQMEMELRGPSGILVSGAADDNRSGYSTRQPSFLAPAAGMHTMEVGDVTGDMDLGLRVETMDSILHDQSEAASSSMAAPGGGGGGGQCRTWCTQLASALRVVGSRGGAMAAAGQQSPAAAPAAAAAASAGSVAALSPRAGLRVGSATALPQPPNAITLYRGLRVRMGLHSGVDDPRAIQFNKVASTFKYHGLFAKTATLVSDAAPGGMIVLSAEAFSRLRHGMQQGAAGPHAHTHPHPLKGKAKASRRAAAAAPALRDLTVMYAGHHYLKDVHAPRQVGVFPRLTSSAQVAIEFNTPIASNALSQLSPDAVDPLSSMDGLALYQAVPPSLVARLALSPPVRSARVVQVGSLLAPTGCVTVAFMKVVGASTLLADLPGPATRALEAFHSSVARRLGDAGPTVPLTHSAPSAAAAAAAAAAAEQAGHFSNTNSGTSTVGVGASGAGGGGHLASIAACAAAAANCGYLVEGGEGLVLAAFANPRAAVEWALSCLEDLQRMEWEDELMSHELCEEVLSIGFAGATPYDAERRSGGVPDRNNNKDGGGGGGMEMEAVLEVGNSSKGNLAMTQRKLDRGLRVKVGIDMGAASHALTESSGRLSYRGRVMNRAARIAGKAAAGQVLCSSAVWNACHGEDGAAAAADPGGYFLQPQSPWRNAVVGISLGDAELKGITSPVELIQCLRENDD